MGATPKDTMSLSESSSLPRKVVTCNFLAMLPSILSNIMANIMKTVAGYGSPRREYFMETRPEAKLEIVIIFGTAFNKLIFTPPI